MKGKKMFNQITLVGNLTRDIELRYAQSGTAIAKTAIATSRKFTSNGEKKDEVRVTSCGRRGASFGRRGASCELRETGCGGDGIRVASRVTLCK